MAIIGSFTKSEIGFTGTLKTLTLRTKLTIQPCSKEHDRAPDHRIFAGDVECGAAWTKSSAAGRDYLSCKLDDPSLPSPLYASLVASDDGEQHALIWSR